MTHAGRHLTDPAGPVLRGPIAYLPPGRVQQGLRQYLPPGRVPQGLRQYLTPNRVPPALRQYLFRRPPLPPRLVAPRPLVVPGPQTCPVQGGACSIVPCRIFVQTGPDQHAMIVPGLAAPCRRRGPQLLHISSRSSATFRSASS